MSPFGKWAGIGVALGALLALPQLATKELDAGTILPSLHKDQAQPDAELFEGLDLTALDIHPRRVAAPLADNRQAILTLDPELQRTANSLMKRYQLPEAGVVLQDVRSGDLLVYASYIHDGPSFDFNARAEAPAASVFKVVTAAALVEFAGLTAESEQCYHGGKSQISVSELEDDPARDKWCASLATAMGRSLNVVFARLAKKNLSVEQLTAMSGALGFGSAVPFESVNEAPSVDMPEDPLEFARASAGFWHSTLSPLAAASLAQTVANQGITLQPNIVREVRENGRTLYTKGEPNVLRRAIKADTALALTQMMTQTTLNGSAYKTFHDKKGRPFLPNITVAGKTGTLSRHKQNRHYTWFVGFAPADKPEVAVAALIVNTPLWRIKGPDLARDVLRAYFAQQGREGVQRP